MIRSILFLALFSLLSPLQSWAQIKNSSCGNYLQGPIFTLKDVSLAEEIAKSGVTPDQLAKMREHFSSFIDIYDLILSPPERGVLLGVMGNSDLYSAVKAATGLTSWDEAYDKFGIGFGESQHTDKFMTTLVNQEDPIIFLIPKNIWSHPHGIHTKKELWWLLQNPEKMKNVIFVFGVLDVLDQDSIQDSLQTTLKLRRNPELRQNPWEMKVKKLALSLKVHASKFRSQKDH